jgi:hypothetical protein
MRWQQLNGKALIVQLLLGETFIDGIIQDAACHITRTQLMQKAPEGDLVA